MFDNNPEEHYLKQGDTNKPTYYIIRHMNEAAELSEIYRMTAGHIWYALSKSWLPVVDMKNYPNRYLSPEKLGAENSWEYYFEQPLRIGLEQAYNGENVVLSDGFKAEVYPKYSEDFLEKKDDTLAEWRTFVKWGFLKIKDTLTEEIKGIHEELFWPKEKILGVLLCEENSSDEKTDEQPAVSFAEIAATLTEEKFEAWKCNKIFLVASDSAVVEMFKNKFEDKCVLLDQPGLGHYDSDISDDTDDSDDADNADNADDSEQPVLENEAFLSGKKYLTQMRLLSLCNYLVAERCADASNVMLMAKKFANTRFFNTDDFKVNTDCEADNVD